MKFVQICTKKPQNNQRYKVLFVVFFTRSSVYTNYSAVNNLQRSALKKNSKAYTSWFLSGFSKDSISLCETEMVNIIDSCNELKVCLDATLKILIHELRVMDKKVLSMYRAWLVGYLSN